MRQAEPGTTTDLSLVLCTYGRTDHVDNFLESISFQSRKPKEIIIVDQNKNDILSEVIKKWQQQLHIIHKRVDFKGASKSRNYGAKEAKCSLIAFPDDDCLYPPSTIEHIVKLFKTQNNVDTVITAKIEPSQINKKNFSTSSEYSRIISILDLFKAKAETSNIFARKTALESLPYIFNEDIGPGTDTAWLSNEETDLLIRLLKQKKIIIKLKDLAIAHHSSQGTVSKSLKYGMGRFEVILNNKLGFNVYIINILQPVVRFLRDPKPYGFLQCISTMIGRSGLINLAHRLVKNIPSIRA